MIHRAACKSIVMVGALLLAGGLVSRAATPEDEAPAEIAGYELSHKVDFTLGEVQLREGDAIVIDEILGTADTILPGNLYLVRGTYRLGSEDKARMVVNVRHDAKGQWPHFRIQGVTLKPGAGRFSLYFYMLGEGRPHISLNPIGTGGPPLANVFFYTGELPLAGDGQQETKPAAAPATTPASRAMATATMGPIMEKLERERELMAGQAAELLKRIEMLDRQLETMERMGVPGGGGGKPGRAEAQPDPRSADETKKRPPD